MARGKIRARETCGMWSPCYFVLTIVTEGGCDGVIYLNVNSH